jgi:hypothetical protein
LKCFVGIWRAYFKPDSGFWMAFTFQGWSSFSWRWWTFRVTKHQQNDGKCWKNSITHPWRPSPNNPWGRRHRWDQLQRLPWDLNRKLEHGLHCSFIMTTRPHTHPWKPQSLWLTTTWLLFPIILLAGLSPVISVCQIENETEGTTFWNSVGLSRKICSVLNATIFTSISPPYDMFWPQTAIIKCSVQAKTVALYKMFTYLYTCKCDVSWLIYLIYTWYLFAMINVTHFLI